MYDLFAPCPGDLRNRERVLRHFDEMAARYSAVRARGFLRWLADRDDRVILDLLDPRPGEHALDAGCGDGRHGRLLAARGLTVWAVDLCPRMVAAAAPHAARALVADLATLELPVAFDRILCAGALDFVEDPPACVERLARHLRPGGRLVVVVPRRTAAALPYRLFHLLRTGIRVHLFDRLPLDAAARRGGLLPVAARRPFLHTIALCWTRAP